MSRLPPNQESAPLVYIFALPAMNGPFPADLNFRENTVCAGILSEQNKKEHKNVLTLSLFKFKYLKKINILNKITVLFILSVICSFLDKTCYKSQG